MGSRNEQCDRCGKSLHNRRTRCWKCYATERSKGAGTTCQVINENGVHCTEGIYNLSRGMCRVHYFRWYRHGDPNVVKTQADTAQRGPSNAGFIGAKVGMIGAHSRCRNLWGSASQFPCITCGIPANDWAYDGTDPEQKYEEQFPSGSWIFFSAWPEFYMPMCRKCHNARDCALKKDQLRHIRQIMHDTGFTLPQIERLCAQKRKALDKAKATNV